MRLEEFAALELIALDLVARDKQDVLQKLVDLLLESGRVRDAAGLMGELLKREQVMSTGIGGGIAIPHALTNDIEALALPISTMVGSVTYADVIGWAYPARQIITFLVPDFFGNPAVPYTTYKKNISVMVVQNNRACTRNQQKICMKFEGKDIMIAEKYNEVYRPCLKDV